MDRVWYAQHGSNAVVVTPTTTLAQTRQAHLQNPEDSKALQAYAEALMGAGEVAEGAELFQQAIRRQPEVPELNFGLLWNQLYLPGYDRDFFTTQYRRWAPVYFADIPQDAFPRRAPRPGHPLRLGLLSGSFCGNSVMAPFEAMAQLLDRQTFSLTVYNNSPTFDLATERWRGLADGFRDIQTVPDDQAARMVYADGMDILLAVGGYCRGSRLGILAWQPAPIQVDFGGQNTLGLPQVKYRLSDVLFDPPATVANYVEQTHYLSPMCPFVPPTPSPRVSELPARQNGLVTFGVFNNHRKINTLGLALWAEILNEVPHARLLLKFPDGHDPGLQDYYRRQLAEFGVAGTRVEIHGQSTYSHHLEMLGRCDMLLDTFPYTGARGTLEALWMGVPTITMVGDRFVSRAGWAAVREVGLEIFAAQDESEYVSKAVSFAQQLDHLETIRLSLRHRLLTSPLCDFTRWTQQFENVLQRICQVEWEGR